MIKVYEKLFCLDTESTSYIFSLTEEGHLEHIHYGNRVNPDDYDALRLKNTVVLGSSVEYSERDNYSLDNLLLEYSGIGKGDYRHSPIELIMPDGSFVTDFVYKSHEIYDGSYKAQTNLPLSYGEASTLTVTLADKKYENIELKLSYSVYEKSNVIVRNTELINGSEGIIYIRKLMSMMTDFPTADYSMMTFNGSWAKESHAALRPVLEGILVNDSTTGSSSNRHNPGFMLIENGADEEQGKVYAFNLIYSGNHYSAVEKSPFGTMRVMTGINPHCFLWGLNPSESFITPQAVLSFGDCGTNSVSRNMHAFVNENIVRGEHKNSDRPVVLNNWEATFFNFNSRKIHPLAREAKKMGVEMLVLDDGWFGKRNSDTAGLGDYNVNTKKLPGGLLALSRYVNKLGLRFGLWVEPECVNEDSELYRNHPEYAVKVPGREASKGRHQLVLDLTRKEVRDYIIDSLDKVLSSANIEYIKWDYNRHISDMYSATLKNQGEFYHRYILGLYEILDEVFHKRHKNVLLESCSSGGNRFDLGMLCYSPQIWTSDNTDPIERLDIQGGIYHLYPQSAVSCHVSMSPHQQTLRSTPLSTRFNVAAFGVLGYELDPTELTPDEKREIKSQIAFYKEHRRLFQYGELAMLKTRKPNQRLWQITKDGETVSGIFQKIAPACPERDSLRVLSLEKGKKYRVTTVGQRLKISRFGGLVKHILPVKLKSDGIIMRTADRHFSLPDGSECYECSGEALSFGINLAMQYMGTGYHKDLRILGDFGSNLYLIEEITEKEEKENG